MFFFFCWGLELTAHVEKEPIGNHKKIQFQCKAATGENEIGWFFPFSSLQIGREWLAATLVRCLVYHVVENWERIYVVLSMHSMWHNIQYMFVGYVYYVYIYIDLVFIYKTKQKYQWRLKQTTPCRLQLKFNYSFRNVCPYIYVYINIYYLGLFSL